MPGSGYYAPRYIHHSKTSKWTLLLLLSFNPYPVSKSTHAILGNWGFTVLAEESNYSLEQSFCRALDAPISNSIYRFSACFYRESKKCFSLKLYWQSNLFLKVVVGKVTISALPEHIFRNRMNIEVLCSYEKWWGSP